MNSSPRIQLESRWVGVGLRWLFVGYTFRFIRVSYLVFCCSNSQFTFNIYSSCLYRTKNVSTFLIKPNVKMFKCNDIYGKKKEWTKGGL